ncbi:phage/plasmid replication protein [Capnocytophaga cynodegmi]|uniref:phage/plasmid replication domain-containing protein n=1 Tax=Capnocytophaga cynodegmi TaxID=28189 RepID=UPI0037CFAADD
MLGFTIDSIRLFVRPEMLYDFDSSSLNFTPIHKNWKEGFYKNFKIKFDKDKGMYLSGSISNYYKGSISLIDYSELKLAIESLSNELKINLHEAKLYRVDLALNIETDKPINQYSHLLFTDLPHFKRLEQKDGVRFETNSKVIAIYNKKQELLEKRKIDVHKDVLRIEFRITKNLSNVFKINKMKMKDLYNPFVYKVLIQTFYKYYHKIKKQVFIEKDNILEDYITPKTFYKYLIEKILSYTCEKDLYRQIDQWDNEKRFKNPMDKSRCRKIIADNLKDSKTAKINPLAEEVNKKVNIECQKILNDIEEKLKNYD